MNKDSIKQLFPLELGGVFDEDIVIEGDHLDNAETRAGDLLTEMFPDTVDELLADWERVYGLVQSSLPTYQRLQNLLAKVRLRPRLDRSYIQSCVFPFVGYTVEIEEYMMFRCDDPLCLTDDDEFAMDEDGLFQFTVIIDPALVETAGYNLPDIQETLDRIKPAHTQAIIEVLT